MLNNGNPNAILKQMIGNATPEQKQGLLSEAKKYGVPDNVLSKIQNMKKLIIAIIINIFKRGGHL